MTDNIMNAISVASVLLPLSIYAVAMPATPQQAFPVVKPGPGLPSLGSLNLTSAQLYQGYSKICLYLFIFSLLMILIEKPAPLSTGLFTLATDFDAFCGGGENDAALVDDVIACFNYLTSLGHQACVVPLSGVTFCTSGTAQVNGAVYDTSGSATSYW